MSRGLNWTGWLLVVHCQSICKLFTIQNFSAAAEVMFQMHIYILAPSRLFQVWIQRVNSSIFRDSGLRTPPPPLDPPVQNIYKLKIQVVTELLDFYILYIIADISFEKFLPGRPKISSRQVSTWYHDKVCERFFKNWMLNVVSLLKYKCQMTGNKLCKPAQRSGAGLRIICYPSSDVYTSITWQN